MAKKDKYEEEYTPMRTPKAQEEQTPAQTTEQTQPQEQQSINPLDMYISNAEQSISYLTDEVKALQEKQNASAENLAKMKADMDEARKNRTSLMGSIIEKQKPVYDENKERRLRGAAIINSLGDMLSAAVRGYHAYGKGGAGVVTKAPMSPAMEEVNKINEMQQKYLNEHKAWENLDLNWKKQQADADIAAAEALYTQEKAVHDKIEEKIEELRKEGVKITDDVRQRVADFYMDQYKAELDIEREKDMALWEKQNGITSSGKSGSGGRSGSAAKTIKQSDAAKYYKRIYGEGAYEWADLADDEKKQLNTKAEDDFATNVYAALIREGANADDYIGKIRALIANGFTADHLLENYKGYNGTLAQCIDEMYETLEYTTYIPRHN